MDKQIVVQRYNNLDGIRSLAATGIICMHIRANIGYSISAEGIMNYVINNLIAGMGSFVSLFFIISGFSMCCGYYDRIKNNQISLNNFYSKRYWKILPFFALLVFMDLAVEVAFNGGITAGSIFEAFADLTLMFGFYTTSGLSVIGVGWTLGIIFGFYILFPFFVFLIWNKKRAWFSFALTLAITLLCDEYFKSGQTLVFSWMCYFVAGGLIYLYKEKICKLIKNAFIGIAVIVIGFIIVYIITNPFGNTIRGGIWNTFKMLSGYSLMVVGALCRDTIVLRNPISKFISGVSLEIYLAHMMIFRVIQKLGFAAVAGENVTSYILTCAVTICGVLIFASIFQYVEKHLSEKKRNFGNKGESIYVKK